MNLGQLSKENEHFVCEYKKIGYKTKTELIDEAVNLLRRNKEKEQREKLVLAEGANYGKSGADYVWESFDDEEFSGAI